MGIIIAVVLIISIMLGWIIFRSKKNEGVEGSLKDVVLDSLETVRSKLEEEKRAFEEARAKELAEREAKIQQKVDSIQSKYNEHYTYLNEALMASNHYFSFSERERFEHDIESLIPELQYLEKIKALQRLGEDAPRFLKTVMILEGLRQQHNKAFVETELEAQKDFFDTALDYPLDQQQRESIVKMEDNCLVVSSAGSGKTSTMIGKLLYLVAQRGVQPSRILTITYTHKAADELTQRLMGTGLSCMTFHKLAMTIVGQVEHVKPNIADNALFYTIFTNQLKKPEFRNSVLNYLTDYKSLVLNEHDYASSIEYYRDRKKYGVLALYTDMDGKTIATKSEEEKKICSYLTELGVDFKYEEPYEVDTMTEEFRQYKPDFSIYYTDKNGYKQRVYLEHFAINAARRVPQWFGNGTPGGWSAANEKYLEGIVWKKDIHKSNGTRLIYTTSANFHDGTIRTRLREILEKAGVPIKEPSKEELIERILSRSKNLENALLQMTQSFINLVKANGKDIEEIRNSAQKRKSVRDVFVIDHIMRPLWDDYQEALRQRGEMDFTDVILTATKYCAEGKWSHRYEHILVDEFQDISVDRYKFLLALRTDIPKTKLYCVGDDWQSIYRFSGSDLSLFSEFSKYFGYTEECKIETTYRFGNPLIEQSSRFVETNPLQKKKKVHPRPVNPPETKISFRAYNNREELQSLIYRMVERVPADKTLYIISRYSYDIRDLASPFIKMEYDNNSDIVSLTIANRKVKFMTIHGSKGLEADYVFMLNCNSGLYGFPSLVSDDPVLDYVLSDSEHYEYAEERRVFYVGITRAKVHTVVLYHNDMPSPFVREMDTSVLINPNPCPWCGDGHKILKYEGWTKNKTPYKVWGCDNRTANCQYFEREFANGEYMTLKGKRFNEMKAGQAVDRTKYKTWK